MAYLVEGCRKLGLSLSAAQQAQFEVYYRELVTWNERLNLTAITGHEEVQVKHFLDSLASLPLIAEQIGDRLPLNKPMRLVDVGTGAGFPGIPLKIVTPALRSDADGRYPKKDCVSSGGGGQAWSLEDVHVVHGPCRRTGSQ